jgi:Secretion system C-terminal sorting domain
MENFNLNFIPTTVTFDPEKWIVSKNNTITLSEDNIEANFSKIKVFPNPTNDVLNIEFGKHEPELIYITDITGKIIFSKSQLGKREKQIQVDTKNFAKGFYILHVNTEDGELSRKIEVK